MSAQQQPATIPAVKERKKVDRFNGMPEEEVALRTLPDHLANDLDIVIVSLACNCRRKTRPRISYPSTSLISQFKFNQPPTLIPLQIKIGINPGLFAAYKGHHYAGPGNHFWKCLHMAGLTEQQMAAEDDYKLLATGIGFTNMVQRATKGSADLTRKEIKEGSTQLLEKLRRFRPKIAVFNGKLIFEVFSGRKEFTFGRQPDCVDGTNTVGLVELCYVI